MARSSRLRGKTSAAPTLSPEQERAWRSVQKFNQMTSTLTSVARALTGNDKLVVRAGKVTETNGIDLVTIRPPLSLGDKQVHDRELCDERDENKSLLCEACRTSEETWRSLQHELAHILGDSIGTFPNNETRRGFAALVDEWHPAEACDHARVIKKASLGCSNYIALFATFHEMASLLWKAIEDARVDSRLFNAKPGIRKAFQSFVYRTFENGVEQPDGTTRPWTESLPNTQLAVGLVIKGEGFKVKPSWFIEPIYKLLHDSDISRVLDGAPNWGVAHDGAIAVMEIIRRLDALGYPMIPKCEIPPPPPPPVDNDDESDDEQKGESDDSDDSDDSESKESDKSGDNNFNNEGKSDDKSDTDPQGETEPDGGDEAGDDSGDSDSDDSDSPNDGGDGLGDSDDDRSSDTEGSGQEQDLTGDGTPGDTANDGEFGDDFENEDDRASGSDKEGRDSDDQSDEESVSGDDGDDDSSDDDGRSGEQQANDSGDLQPEGDCKQDQTQGDGSSFGEGETEAGEDQPEEGDQGDAESAASDESADTDGTSPSQVGDGDVSGEPADPSGNSSPENTNPPVQRDDDSGGDDDENQSESDVDRSSVDRASSELDESDDFDDVDIWNEKYDGIDMSGIEAEHLGDAEQVKLEIEDNDPHEHIEPAEAGDDPDSVSAAAEAMNLALMQSTFFDTARVGVAGVMEYEYPNANMRWEPANLSIRSVERLMPDEGILGSALLKARKVFADNRKANHERSLKSGRVDPRVLGRRAALNDERLFRRRTIPARKDYVVGITMDCSGSNNTGARMERAKRAVMAKAELLHRLGIKFYITAHTGGMPAWFDESLYSQRDLDSNYYVMFLWVKHLDEPWTDATRKKLAAIQPLAGNFDGHTLEYHRKLLSDIKATDKILIYYTDGEMPAANHDEELFILQEELKRCDREGIVRLAVGINSSSPKDYGFDTVRVDSDSDLVKVVAQLERYLTK